MNENGGAAEAHRCDCSFPTRNRVKRALSEREAIMFDFTGNSQEQNDLMERTTSAKRLMATM